MTRSYEDRLVRVVNYIHDNLDGDLSLDALADVAAMSRFHWHRIWTAMTGETLAQTTRRVRLYRAAVMLALEDAPVETIAARCGYPDRASFARAFRETMGVTPGKYRSYGRATPPLWPNRKDITVTYDVKLTTQSPRRVAGVLHEGSYQEISRAFETLGTTLAARGAIHLMAGMLGIFHHDPRNVPEADLRALAGVSVDPILTLPSPFRKLSCRAENMPCCAFPAPIPDSRAPMTTFWAPGWPKADGTRTKAPVSKSISIRRWTPPRRRF